MSAYTDELTRAAIHDARTLAATPTHDLADPFATPEDTRQARRDQIITGGRYRLPYINGEHKPRGWMRTSNLVGAFSDQKQLQNWTVRTALAGLVADPRLYDALRFAVETIGGTDPESVKLGQDRLLEIAEQAKDAAGGGKGRDRGNRVHALTECEWRDVPYVATESERALLRLFAAALAGANLSPIQGMQERIVIVEALEACGTLDTLLRDLTTNLVHVGDTKTQKKFWTWLEVEAQLAFYANGDAMWCPDTKAWVPMPYEVNRTRGAALWCPAPTEEHPEPRVEVKPLDLERGWETVQLARKIVLQRSAAKSTRQTVSGLTWEAVRPLSTVEQYARLLDSIETREDGSRLYRECVDLGIWGPELEQVAARKLASL